MARVVKQTKLLSTCCKRCQWYESKTSVKSKGRKLSANAFGLCTNIGMELIDKQVPNGPVPCGHYMFKPCSGSGTTYIVFNTKSGVIVFYTPILAEAKAIAAKYNNPDIIAAKVTKVK